MIWTDVISYVTLGLFAVVLLSWLLNLLLLALKKPMLLIPYPKEASRGDQILNARSFEQRGLAHVLMQEDMTPDTLLTAVVDTYKDRGRLIDAMERESSSDGVANVMHLIHQYARKD